jgi:hypothetical protein
MTRLVRYGLPGLCALACARLALASTADAGAYARRVVACYVENGLASEEYSASPFKMAVTAYRIKKVKVDNDQLHVTVSFRTVYMCDCMWSEYYRPARWVDYTFGLDRPFSGVIEQDCRLGIRLDILGRKRVARTERQTLYYVIAGSFKTEAAATRHATLVSRKEGECGFSVLRSSDYAGLRPGYFIVVQQCDYPWQHDSLSDARRTVALYRQRGIDSYIKRIPPLQSF